MDIWDLRKYRRETLTEAQRAKLLPSMVDEYNCPPVDSILYNRSQDFKSGIVTGYLKREFWELERRSAQGTARTSNRSRQGRNRKAL